jgi:hypothetical protein
VKQGERLVVENTVAAFMHFRSAMPSLTSILPAMALGLFAGRHITLRLSREQSVSLKCGLPLSQRLSLPQ